MRIRLEAEAVTMILDRVDRGMDAHVSSQIAEIEIAADPDPERRRRVSVLLPRRGDRIRLSAAMFARARRLGSLGFKPADTLHVAAAELCGADALLTCDDRFLRAARRHRTALRVQVMSPLVWLEEQSDAPNA